MVAYRAWTEAGSLCQDMSQALGRVGPRA